MTAAQRNPDQADTGCLPSFSITVRDGRWQGPGVWRDGLRLVMTGWLARPAELRRRLGLPAQADHPALLAAAARRWSGELSRHLDGEYAAAIWDPVPRRLLLVHDELGLAPLFYRRDGSAVASRLESLAGGELDERYLADVLLAGQHDASRTPWRSVARLRAAESVSCGPPGLRSRRHWTLDTVRTPRLATRAEYEQGLRDLLDQAVTEATAGATSTWCEVSGGLDSSTVACVAARLGVPGLAALSLVSRPGSQDDERGWIGQVLDRHPMPWHPISSDTVRPFSAPPARCAEPTQWVLMAARRQAYASVIEAGGAQLVLTGEGGDAAFGGNEPLPYRLADLLVTGRLGSLWKQAGRWHAGDEARRAPGYFVARAALRPSVAWLRRRPVELSVQPAGWLDRDFIQQHQAIARCTRSAAPPTGGPGRTWQLERILLAAKLVETNYAQSGWPAQFRHPLLYRPLLAFLLGVPAEHAMAPRPDRLLQRRALAGVLPEPIRLRRGKSGEDAEVFAGLASDSGWYDRLRNHSALVARGWVDPVRWRQAVDRARAGQTTGMKTFLASAAVDAWLEPWS